MLEELMGKSKNKKQLVAVTLLLAAMFIGWNFIARPMLIKIKNAETDKVDLVQKEAVFKAIVEMENKIFVHKRFFVESKDRNALIGQLSALAAKSSLVINSVTPEDQPGYSQINDFEKISLKIEASGNYHSLGQFISQVESLDYFAKIVRLEIGNNDKTNDSPEAPVTQPVGGVKSYKISVTVGILYPSKDALT